MKIAFSVLSGPWERRLNIFPIYATVTRIERVNLQLKTFSWKLWWRTIAYFVSINVQWRFSITNVYYEDKLENLYKFDFQSLPSSDEGCSSSSEFSTSLPLSSSSPLLSSSSLSASLSLLFTVFLEVLNSLKEKIKNNNSNNNNNNNNDNDYDNNNKTKRIRLLLPKTVSGKRKPLLKVNLVFQRPSRLISNAQFIKCKWITTELNS